MRTTKYFLVKPAIAERAGVLSQRYRTADGLMVLNEQDMGKVRLQPEEYLTGVVEQVINEREAQVLIEQGGRKLGIDQSTDGEKQPSDDEEVVATEKSVATGDEQQGEDLPSDAAESVPAGDVESDGQECVTNNEAEEGQSDE